MAQQFEARGAFRTSARKRRAPVARALSTQPVEPGRKVTRNPHLLSTGPARQPGGHDRFDLLAGSRARVPPGPEEGGEEAARRPPASAIGLRPATSAKARRYLRRSRNTSTRALPRGRPLRGRRGRRVAAAPPARPRRACRSRGRWLGSRGSHRIGEAREAANFHLVGATAAGAHAERPEHRRLRRLDWLDSERSRFGRASGAAIRLRRSSATPAAAGAQARRAPCGAFEPASPWPLPMANQKIQAWRENAKVMAARRSTRRPAG